MIPLYITAQRFAGEVVFVVLEYHYWWLGRYGAVLEQLTNYKVVDFRYDRRVHCFSEMIVGLRVHGELQALCAATSISPQPASHMCRT